MKKIVKNLFLLSLVCFSFFYTDKVIELINKNDPLMLQITSVKNEYETVSVDAIITDSTIIPGIKGKVVDVDKSYENMKIGGVFREDALIYNEVIPSNSIVNNRGKYIIKGNANRKEVSILYIIDSRDDISIVKGIGDISLFINTKYLNIYNIKELKNNELYSYGNNGIYSREIFDNDNTLINRLSNNKSIYCLSKEENSDVLNVCNNNDMYVVVPNIVGDYFDVKKSLSNGSIILLDSVDNINVITKYIKGKGYNIVGLSKLLEE